MHFFNISYMDLTIDKRETLKETIIERVREDEEAMSMLAKMAKEAHDSGSNGGLSIEERIDMAVENEAEEQIRLNFSASGEV